MSKKKKHHKKDAKRKFHLTSNYSYNASIIIKRGFTSLCFFLDQHKNSKFNPHEEVDSTLLQPLSLYNWNGCVRLL